MAKAISNKNVLDAKFDEAQFVGKWLASFGKPELRGSWSISGVSGSGKTQFVLQLGGYLSQFRKVAFNPLEQGVSKSFQIAWKRANMAQYGNNVVVLPKEQISELRARLRKKKSPDIVFIDSVMCLVGFNRREYIKLIEEFPTKLFIFISHEKNKKPDPAIAETIRRLSDIKIRVEGYKAFITTRFANPEKGEGGADFIIWEKGANEYWAENL